MKLVEVHGNEAMLHIMEGKLDKMTDNVPTLRMERITMDM